MIMPKSSDLLQFGGSVRQGILWRHADVTDSARALAQAHLCGPTAALVLGEALAGVALLSHELTQPEEAIALHLRVKGPIRGVTVEATRDGALRGYPRIKILNDLDGNEEILSAPALGQSGEAQILRSVPGRLISRAGVDAAPPAIEKIVNRYLNHSLQRTAFAVILAIPYVDGVDLARAVLVECPPGGDQHTFARLYARVGDGSFAEALEMADGAHGFCEEIGLPAGEAEPPRPLRFACRCSEERAMATLATLQPEELRDMAAAGKPADIYCHMCGRQYSFDTGTLLRLADEHGDTQTGEAPHA